MTAKATEFTKIGDGLPDFVTSTGEVTEHSNLIEMRKSNNKSVRGYAMRYKVDVNAEHIAKKAGDVVFYDLENTPVDKVTAWRLIN